jgi:hypothetical protein
VETQFIRDLGGIHCVGQILFICEHEEEGVTELVFVQHALEFFTSFRDTLAIVGIDDKDDALGVLEV